MPKVLRPETGAISSLQLTAVGIYLPSPLNQKKRLIPKLYADYYAEGIPFIAVVGRRYFTDQKRMWKELDQDFEEQGPFVVVSGGARGPDKMAEDWARSKKDFPEPWIFPAIWNVPIIQNGEIVGHKKDMKAGFKRNTDIAEVCHFAYVYWDRICDGGTFDTITKLRKLGKEVKIRKV